MDAKLEEACLQTAWSIVNDSYRVDVGLFHPPYMIALAATHMACIYFKKDPTKWFDTLSVDMREVRCPRCVPRRFCTQI